MPPNEPAEAAEQFELMPAVYDALVDWPRRLEREAAFFRDHLAAAPGRRVLDLACGTGHHAAMFAEWGYDVCGTDGSAEMIAYCRARHGESERLRWATDRLEAPRRGDEQFDAITCLGNSLALLPDLATARAAISGMAGALVAGGLLIVQVLNLWRLPDGPVVWQKAARTRAGRDVLIVKGVHRAGSRGFVDTAEIWLDAPNIKRCRSTPLVALRAEDLRSAFEATGFEDVRAYGSHAREPYAQSASPDLICTGRLRR